MQCVGERSGLFYKYSKISQQQKFHLVCLVVRERRSIKEAARVVGINYSTAKTIIFFHRNHLKSYQFDLARNPRAKRVAAFRLLAGEPQGHCSGNSQGHQSPSSASLFTLSPSYPPQQVQLVCSIGSKVANPDFNSLQTRFMGNRLDHAGGGSAGELQVSEPTPLELGSICQCERRQTRAQSAKQAAKLTFSPPATRQEQSCEDISEQHNKQ